MKILEFLLDRIKPSIVLAHGAKTGTILDKLDVPCFRESGPHVSRWSYPDAAAFGQRLAQQFR